MLDILSEFKVEKDFKSIQACSDCSLYMLVVNKFDPPNGKLVLSGQYKNDGSLKILFIGIAPSSRARFDKQLRAFFPASLEESSSGAIFFSALVAEKWVEKYDLYVTNLVKCSTKNFEFPDDQSLNRCKKWLSKELYSIRPDWIICLGSRTFEEFTKSYVAELTDLKKTRVYYMKHPAYYYRWRDSIGMANELRVVERKLVT